MLDIGSFYKKKVYFLAQKFFIADNKDELLHFAHKYDFDINFFDQVNDFVMGVMVSTDEDLYVIDVDCLNNIQDSIRKFYLSDLLDKLPKDKNYIFLQNSKHLSRYHLQKKLIENKCLAYLEKPIPNEYLIEKLFNIFLGKKRDRRSKILIVDYPGAGSIQISSMYLMQHNIEFKYHHEIDRLNSAIKEYRPDIVMINQSIFKEYEDIASILKKNIEFDNSMELILYMESNEIRDMQYALLRGFDDAVFSINSNFTSHYLYNKISKIRMNKNLINQDRATGLLNKTGLQNYTIDLLKQASVNKVPIALGITDIDKFKTINDTYGHFFGDIVIKRIAMLLQSRIGEKDLLGRFGGEEFVWVMWDTTPEDALHKMDLARQEFNQILFEVNSDTIKQFSFSGGVACYPQFKTENELFLQADEMLYEAKQNGRNQIRIKT